MSSSSCIEQKGVVEAYSNGIAKVNITAHSACASCHSKSSCLSMDTSEKVLDIPTDTAVKKGDVVQVAMHKELGIRATLLAYVLPFVVILISLLLMTSLGLHEGVAGLISLAAAGVYYYILHLNKGSLQKTFRFTISKVN